MPNYTYTNLKDAIISDASTISNILGIINRSVREVVSEIDLRSTKRKAQISPEIMDQVYTYGAAGDLKELAIIDLQPQVGRLVDSELELVTTEEFDRLKSVRNNIVAITDEDFIKKLQVSVALDSLEKVIHQCDSITGDGTWTAGGSASNLTIDTFNVINGFSSLNFDIGASYTSATLTNSSMNSVDLSDYENHQLFVWTRIPSTTGLTSFKLRWGNDSSNYWESTVTTNNEGTSFYNGFNLLRFNWSSATVVGSPDSSNVDYLVFQVVGDGTASATTDWIIDFVVARVGKIYNQIYYSKYGWQSSGGTWKENSTTSSDLLNADTEEFELFVLHGKAVLFREQYLYGDADQNDALYEIKKARYLEKYPSERKLLISNYREFDTW